MKANTMTAAAPAEAAYKKIAAEQPPRAIHSEREYRHWKRILDGILAMPETEMTKAEASYAETVALLIEVYERGRYALREATPAEALAELMAAHNLKQKEVVDIFGSEAAVSYALHGKRNLTVEQIRRLAAKFRVSPAVFV